MVKHRGQSGLQTESDRDRDTVAIVNELLAKRVSTKSVLFSLYVVRSFLLRVVAKFLETHSKCRASLALEKVSCGEYQKELILWTRQSTFRCILVPLLPLGLTFLILSFKLCIPLSFPLIAVSPICPEQIKMFLFQSRIDML